MSVLLRVLPLVAAVAGLLLPAGAQVPVKGGEVSDFDFAVDVVERAYAGYPDKTANRAAEYGALKERLRSGIASGRDTYDAVAEYLGWFDDSHLGTEGVRAYRPKSIRRPSDYAARMERYDPQFTHCRVDGETYLIRFPSCDLNEEQTAWVRTAVRAYLASGCENQILDLRGNRIEGRLEKGQKVVVIEDLISTGGSCIEVVEALREAGAEVLGVASIFTYGMQKGLDRMREANVTNYSLSNLDALVEVAAEEGYIKPEDKARLIAFRNNPSDESWMQ